MNPYQARCNRVSAQNQNRPARRPSGRIKVILTRIVAFRNDKPAEAGSSSPVAGLHKQKVCRGSLE